MCLFWGVTGHEHVPDQPAGILSPDVIDCEHHEWRGEKDLPACSMLLYVLRDHKNYYGLGAQDGHLDFHTAPHSRKPNLSKVESGHLMDWSPPRGRLCARPDISPESNPVHTTKSVR